MADLNGEQGSEAKTAADKINLDRTEERILKIIDENAEEIIAFARDIYTHGELGYKEFETSRKFAGFMKRLGLEVEEGLAVTGVKSYLNLTKKDNVSLALIGELDALRIPEHKCANRDTQAAHCCGHNAQLAGVIGAAIALSAPEVADKLDGQVVFFAVPAEEYGEIEFKNSLKQQGKIRYGGGKCELIRIGAFDDIDLSIAHHISCSDDITFHRKSNNGFVSKVIKYKGRASHAAGAPENGVNALNAASLGLSALAYQRETFKDDDHVRVHPIITKGGNLVNVVPDEVVIETLVRASGIDAILDAAEKTDRAFRAGALAIGAKVEIETMPGYLPTIPQEPEPELVDAARLAAVFGSGLEGRKAYNVVIEEPNYSGGSTDVGDLQHIQPVLVFNTGGAKGGLHSAVYEITDEELAYVTTARIFALGAYRLLRDGAVKAKEILNNYTPPLTKEQYIDYMESMIKRETY